MALDLIMDVEYIVNAVERGVISRVTANIALLEILEEAKYRSLPPEEVCPCFYGGGCPSNYKHKEDRK